MSPSVILITPKLYLRRGVAGLALGVFLLSSILNPSFGLAQEQADSGQSAVAETAETTLPVGTAEAIEVASPTETVLPAENVLPAASEETAPVLDETGPLPLPDAEETAGEAIGQISDYDSFTETWDQVDKALPDDKEPAVEETIGQVSDFDGFDKALEKAEGKEQADSQLDKLYPDLDLLNIEAPEAKDAEDTEDVVDGVAEVVGEGDQEAEAVEEMVIPTADTETTEPDLETVEDNPEPADVPEEAKEEVKTVEELATEKLAKSRDITVSEEMTVATVPLPKEAESKVLAWQDSPDFSADKSVGENTEGVAQGKIKVLLDKDTDQAKLIFAEDISLAYAEMNLDNIEQYVAAFMATNPALFGINPSNLRLGQKSLNNGKIYLNYYQYYQGLPVFYRGISMVVATNGKLLSVALDCAPQVDLDLNQQGLSEEEISQKAQSYVNFDPLTDKITVNGRVIYPEELEDKTYNYHLAYEVNTHSRDPLGDFIFIMDAASGELLTSYNRLSLFSGTIAGQITGSADNKPFVDVTVRAGEEATGTDENGVFNVSADNFGAALENSHLNVGNDDQADALLSGSVGSSVFYFDDSNSTEAERDAYYQINRVYRYFKGVFGYDRLDIPLPVTVFSHEVDDDFWGCVAYYDPAEKKIELGRGGCGNGNFALSADILIHEYIHAVVNQIYSLPNIPGSESGAINEGLSDYYAASLNNDSQVGEDALATSRNVDNSLKIPEDWTGEIHQDSQIFSGALWDIRKQLGALETDRLIYNALYGYRRNFEDFMYQMIVEDDNDQDLTNGTPNLQLILDSFYTHGIGPGFAGFAGVPEQFIPEAPEPGEGELMGAGAVQWTANGVVIGNAAYTQQTAVEIPDGSGGAIIAWEENRSGNWDIYAQKVSSGGVAAWTANGVAICTATSTQQYPQIVSDGSGGAIITWHDFRGTDYDIYAQRINSTGTAQWAANGVVISTASNTQQYPQMISDGSGGAIITWKDGRGGTYDIYAQRVNSAGAVQWTANGVVICAAADAQESPYIVSDGSSGAIITWQDFRSGTADIYAQRINSTGVVQWTADGVAICTAADTQGLSQLISDGSGGAIIAWSDYRGGNWDVYAQRINSTGIVQWAANGVVISSAGSMQYNERLVSDGSNGAIIVWQDNRNGTDFDIYAQRVNSSGTVQWTANGVAVSVASNDQTTPQIISDGSSGAIITWQDFRGGTYYDIYAQRINSSGTAQWGANGVAICTAANSQSFPLIVSDGTGPPNGAIMVWLDTRSGNYAHYAARVDSVGTLQFSNVVICNPFDEQGTPQIASDGSGGSIMVWQDWRSGSWDIYAQRINSSGAVQWTANGVVISNAANNQIKPQIISDGSGGAIITWESGGDIYAQRVNSSGTVQWTANGVAICTAASSQGDPELVSDGSSGAIITWMDYRGAAYDIYAQRVNSAGAVQWTANGVAISTAANSQSYPQIVSDGSSGAIITWMDYRPGATTDVYAQRVNSAGTVQWTADGVAISTASNLQYFPQIVSDGAGGAIITWDDYRSGTSYDVYAQKINAAGAVQWTVNGLVISTAANHQSSSEIASDGSGGAIIAWGDTRGGSVSDIYAQRVNSAGAVQWTADGVAVSVASNDQTTPQIISDGAGGAIITWMDLRGGATQDIYAQQINSSGAVQWTANGVAICTASDEQGAPQLVLADSLSAIITWRDKRNSNYDVYAQKITWDPPAAVPTNGTITPSSGTYSSFTADGETVYRFTTTHSDADGYADLDYAELLISDVSTTKDAYTGTNGVFYGRYDQDDDKFYLRNADNTAWLDASASDQEQTYAKLKSTSEDSCASNTCTLYWDIVFKGGWGETVNTYLNTVDAGAQTPGFEDKGDATISRTPNPEPAEVGLDYLSAGYEQSYYADLADFTEIDPDSHLAADTYNGISMTAGSTASWDGAVISNRKFPRQTGLTAYFKITTPASIGTAKDRFMVGWETDQTASANYTNLAYGLYFAQDGGLGVYEKGNNRGVTGFSYQVSTTYETRVQLEDTGAIYSIKGGAYTDWTVVYTSSNYTDSPLRLGIHSCGATGKVNKVAVYNATQATEWDFRGTGTFTNMYEIENNGDRIQKNNGVVLLGGDTDWYSALISKQSFTRRAGDTAYFKITPTSAVNLMVGWDIDQTTNSHYNQCKYCIYFISNNTFQAREDGVSRGVVGSGYTTGSTYELRFVLKDAGATYQIKGGSQYANWTTLYDSTYDSTATLRVAVHQRDITGTISEIRVLSKPNTASIELDSDSGTNLGYVDSKTAGSAVSSYDLDFWSKLFTGFDYDLFISTTSTVSKHFDKNWQYLISVGSLDAYTGVVLDPIRSDPTTATAVVYIQDWSGNEINKYNVTNNGSTWVEQAFSYNLGFAGDYCLGITTDGRYLYCNRRTGSVYRYLINSGDLTAKGYFTHGSVGEGVVYHDGYLYVGVGAAETSTDTVKIYDVRQWADGNTEWSEVEVGSFSTAAQTADFEMLATDGQYLHIVNGGATTVYRYKLLPNYTLEKQESLSAALADNFNDNEINTEKWIYNGVSGSGDTITEQNNRLEVTYNGASAPGTQYRSRQIEGDFVLDMDLTVASGSGCLLWLGDLNGSASSRGYTVCRSGTSTRIWERHANGSWTSIYFTDTSWDLSEMHHFRIAKAGSAFKFYQNGTLLLSNSAAAPTEVYLITGYFWNDAQEDAVTEYWDNVQIYNLSEDFDSDMGIWTQNAVGSITGSISSSKYVITGATADGNYVINDTTDSGNQHQAISSLPSGDYVVTFTTTMSDTVGNRYGQGGIALIDSTDGSKRIEVFAGLADKDTVNTIIKREAVVGSTAASVQSTATSDTVDWKIIKKGYIVSVYQNGELLAQDKVLAVPDKLAIVAAQSASFAFVDSVFLDNLRIQSLSSFTPVDGIFEDFNDNTLNGWVDHSGVYSATTGDLKSTSTTGAWQKAINYDRSYSDFIFEGDYKLLNAAMYPGFIFRQQGTTGADTSLLVYGKEDADYWRTYEFGGGGQLDSVSTSVGLDTNIWHHFKIKMVKDSIKFWVDGQFIMESIYPTIYSSGYIGFMRHSGGAEFDNIKVTPILAKSSSLYEDNDVSDTLAPPAVNGLAASADSTSQITLGWSESTYDVSSVARYSTAAANNLGKIIGESQATNVALASAGTTASASSSYDGTYIPSKAIDNDTSELSMWASQNTGSPNSSEYITLNFNQPRIINKIKVLPRNTSSTSREYTGLAFNIQISNDGSNFRPIGYRIDSEWDQDWSTYYFPPVQTKYLKINFTKAGCKDNITACYIEIGEIEAYEAVTEDVPVNAGMRDYEIAGSATQILNGTSYVNSGLSTNTQYTYQVASRDGNGNRAPYVSVSKYTLAAVPSAPTVNGAAATTLNVTINANGNPAATEFAIYEESTGKYLAAGKTLTSATEVWQNAATWGSPITVTGLSVNTQYTFKIKARNGNNTETAFSSTTALYTLANVPSAPTVSNAQNTTLDVAINENGNPAGTEFAIYVSPAVGGNNWVQANGSVGASEIWQNKATWGTKTVTGLANATEYTFQVKARNGNNTETSLSSGTAKYTNRAPSVDLNTDMSNDPSAMYGGKSYTIHVAYHDQDGYANMNKAWFTFDNGTDDIVLEADAGADASGVSATILSGSGYVTSATYNRNNSGSDMTISWMVTLDWDWVDSAGSIDLIASCEDDTSTSSGNSTKDKNASYEKDLVVYSVTYTMGDEEYDSSAGDIVDGDWLKGSETLAATGTVVYQGTTNVYPPVATAIRAQLWADGSDTGDSYQDDLDVNGQFLISDYTLPGSTDSSYQLDVKLENIPSGGSEVDASISASLPWTANGKAISSAADIQENHQIASDGSGGAIIVWEDYRSGSSDDIYAQRVDASGVAQWAADGIVISSATGNQVTPQIISDGSGGAIIVWRDGRNGNNDIYAQRINAAGAEQWTAGGVEICIEAGAQSIPQLTSDGAGGAIIAWEDWRSGSSWDIYTQKVNSVGATQWTAGGVAISVVALHQQKAQIISDGSGGAIITWEDHRTVTGDIYAQKINSAGAVQWTADGMAVCDNTNNQTVPQIASDSAGGAIIAWQDNRNGNNDVYAQRVSSNGVAQWADDGIAVVSAAQAQSNPKIVSDIAGGAIITWEDWRSGSSWDIYTQKINAAGAAQWTADGVATCTAANHQQSPDIASDGSGGAIIAWHDARGANKDIYAQHMSSGGTVQWTADGEAVSAAGNVQQIPQIIDVGSNSAAIVWQDLRSDALGDIYAQKITQVETGAVPITAKVDADTPAISSIDMPPNSITSSRRPTMKVFYSDSDSGIDTNNTLFGEDEVEITDGVTKTASSIIWNPTGDLAYGKHPFGTMVCDAVSNCNFDYAVADAWDVWVDNFTVSINAATTNIALDGLTNDATSDVNTMVTITTYGAEVDVKAWKNGLLAHSGYGALTVDDWNGSDGYGYSKQTSTDGGGSWSGFGAYGSMANSGSYTTVHTFAALGTPSDTLKTYKVEVKYRVKDAFTLQAGAYTNTPDYIITPTY